MGKESTKGKGRRKLRPLYYVSAIKKQGAGGYSTIVTIPKAIAEELGIKPEDIILARLLETEIDGKPVRGVFFYKPQP